MVYDWRHVWGLWLRYWLFADLCFVDSGSSHVADEELFLPGGGEGFTGDTEWCGFSAEEEPSV